MIKEEIHKALIANFDNVHEWLEEQRKEHKFSIYTSVDIRDSGFKISSVDANIYPAGFNNICQTDKDNASEVFKDYFSNYYNAKSDKILLITEEHTNNKYYWENVCSLAQMIKDTGIDIRIAMPKEMDLIEVETASGKKFQVYGAKRKGNSVVLDDGFEPDVIISNNDFSSSYEDWSEGLEVPINPFRELGWYQRKKSTHFQFYNCLVNEFSKVIDIDPWWLRVDSEVFTDFDISSDYSKKALAEKVDLMLARIEKNYKERKIDRKAKVFVKNNSGTYGLAVVKVESGDDILSWNNRTRTKMKAAKGGRQVEELLLQEAVPSVIKAKDSIAEPVIYLVGNKLLGGFLRAHDKKGPDDSLNSPGAVYQKMCVTDLKINPGNCPMENVYGWTAKLSSLAISKEIQALDL